MRDLDQDMKDTLEEIKDPKINLECSQEVKERDRSPLLQFSQ